VVTLKTYSNPVEAGIAKSILDEHDIFCSLADENANAYGGAPFAMPVRLLVNDGQADEALRILNTMAQPRSSGVEHVDNSDEDSSTGNELTGIREELKKLRGRIESNTAFVILLFAALFFFFLVQLNSPVSARSRQRQVESWNTARTALKGTS